MAAPTGEFACNEYIQARFLKTCFPCLHGHLWGCSEAVAPEAALGPAPFSVGGGEPHLPSDSFGSSICTPPSESPNAN